MFFAKHLKFKTMFVFKLLRYTERLLPVPEAQTINLGLLGLESFQCSFLSSTSAGGWE